jgi:VanZ family protein
LYFAPFLVCIWAFIILVAGCTSDAHAFLYNQVIHFQVEFAPNFRDLLITNDIHFKKKFYVIQKIGHIVAFGILYFFLLHWIKRQVSAIILCGSFALYTEILQLFFSRNGRFFDVGIDMVGILITYFLCRNFYVNTKEVSVTEYYV